MPTIDATPTAVDASWRAFFDGLKDDRDASSRTPRAPPGSAGWPEAANGELVSALDGNWAALEQAVGEKIRAEAGAGGAAALGRRDRPGDARHSCAPS